MARRPDPALPATALRRALLRWYRRQHRRLPWRAEPPARPDPYHVLLSEFMLQQTQVATVVDYFQRFVAAFPTLEKLAAAEEQRVLALWQGLGYYRRARNLHAAARRIVAENYGQVPRTADDLQRLPGVGRYTAGAIASIAYGVRAPVVDGNVARVLARCLALRRPPGSPDGQRVLWSAAQALLPPARPRGSPGDFNQALMELGATVCTPAGPRCGECPLAPWCLAQRRGLTASIPVAAPRTAPRAVEHHVLVVQRRGRCLLVRRPGEGMWASMWQCPTLEEAPTPVDARRLARWLQQAHGVACLPPVRGESFRHATSHRAIRFVVWHCQVRPVGKGGGAAHDVALWRKLDDTRDLPMARPQRRILESLGGTTERPGRSE